MNIDLYGRLRPSLRGEGAHSLFIEGNKRIAVGPAGPYFNFHTLFRDHHTNYDVYKRVTEPLLDLFVDGLNVCLLVFGETGSGKSYSLAGESMGKSGMVSILLENLFARLSQDQLAYSRRSNISMAVYEIYNEMVKDLTQFSSGTSTYQDLTETAEKGVYVKNSHPVPINSAKDATMMFRQAWNRRTDSQTDYGPAQNDASVIIQIDLERHLPDSPLPNVSRFTIVDLAGAEKLAEESGRLRMREGPTLSKGIHAFAELVANLSNNPQPNRVINYKESKLTHLLKDEIGGNCKTNALVCLKPHSTPEVMNAVINTASELAQVKNFPLINDYIAQHLVVQYRARLLGLQQDLGFGAGMADPGQVTDVREELRRVNTENLQLRERIERLQLKLEQLQGKFGTLAENKTDISSQLLTTEEEKLRVSKTLVDMQIENNRIREEAEATKFELTNKILTLENDLMELELERDKQTKVAKNAKERLTELEQDRKELADEYVVLKTNYLTLTKEHENEVGKNEELSMELLNLVNAKASLMRQLEDQELGVGNPDHEVDRIRAVVSRLSTRRVKPSELAAAEEDRRSVERRLFSNQKKFQGQMDKMKNQYEESHEKMESKMGNLKKEVQDLRNLARERQQKVSEINAQLITVRSNRDELQSENNRLQHKIKDMNEEYRARLVKYVEDISEYVDSGSGVPDHMKTEEQMQQYVNNMIKDIKRSFKAREEQLSQAAQGFKNKMNKVVRRHEELLVAYRQLRQQIEVKGFDDLDLGPDEFSFQMSDQELQSATQREIFRLKEELGRVHNELETLKLRVRIDPKGDISPRKSYDKGTENWSSLRKSLRDFTLTTQRELEDERALLLSRNHALEEQLKECQEYIDSHLVRYKQEIVRLRHMLGIEEDGRISDLGRSDLGRSKKGKSRKDQ